MKQLFEKYNIEIREIGGSTTVVALDKNSRILSHFLDFWNKPEEIREYLMPKLEAIINKETEYDDIGADVIGAAFIEQEKTELTSSELGFSDMELPTSDFKGLVLEWLEFLEKEGK